MNTILVVCALGVLLPSVARPESIQTADTEKLYGFIYLHPKEIDRETLPGDGSVSISYKDGTTIHTTESELNIQRANESLAITNFYNDPSKETFARLTPMDKYLAVKTTLKGGPITEFPRGSDINVRDFIGKEPLQLLKAQSQMREAYSQQFDSAANEYLQSLPKAEQTRIRQYALNEALREIVDREAGPVGLGTIIRLGPLDRLIRDTTSDAPGKLRQLICEQLYSPYFETDSAPGFVNDIAVLRAVEPLLRASPDRSSLLEQRCPTKNGDEFQIGTRVKKLAEDSKSIVEARDNQAVSATVVRPTLNCEIQDLREYAKQAEWALINAGPIPSEYWGSYEKRACRIMGRVLKSKSGELSFTFFPGSLGDPSAPPFKIGSFKKLFAIYDAAERIKPPAARAPNKLNAPTPVRLDVSAAVLRPPARPESGAAIMNPFARSSTRQ
jgi:hypothetical protein